MLPLHMVVHMVVDMLMHVHVVCQSKKCQKGVNSLQHVPPDDTQVNCAMLCCQYCHNIGAEYTEGRAAWHQSLDLLHCPVGLNATGSKHFNSNENTMRKIKNKGADNHTATSYIESSWCFKYTILGLN